MYQRLAMMCACFVVALSAGAADVAKPIESARLLNGQELTGQIRVLEGGIYLATENGGSMYSWAKVDPASLPAELREAKRQEYLDQLGLAQSYYLSEQYAAAAPLFRRVYEHERYLLDDDIAGDNWRGITYKMRGLVEDEGRWRTVAAIKADQGLFAFEGQWLTQDEIKVARTYRAAFAKAREVDIPAAIMALKAAVAAYPDSPYSEVANQMVDRLVEKAVAPTPAPAPVAAQAVQARSQPQFVPERDRPRGRTSTFDSPRYYGTTSYRYGSYYYGSYPSSYYYYNGSVRYVYPGTYGRSHHGHRGSHSSQSNHRRSGNYIRYGGLQISF